MASSAESSIRWFGTGMLTLGLSGAALLATGYAPMLGANIGALGACSAPMLGELRVLPLPFDPVQGPLSITVELHRPVDAITGELIDGEMIVATVPFDVQGDRAAAIWSGKDGAGREVQAGSYVVRLRATSARCDETRVSPLELRPSAATFVRLRAGEELRLGTRKQDGEAAAVTWTSSDPSVLTVDADGTVKAVATGQAVLRPRGSAARSIEVQVD